jgi:hypothetical protein
MNLKILKIKILKPPLQGVFYFHIIQLKALSFMLYALGVKR